MTPKDVADQLTMLCRTGRNLEAIETLFDDGAVTVEASGNEEMPATMTGKAAIRGKNEWWVQNHDVHYAAVRGPFPNGDRFALIFDYEVTPKAGPGAGQRMRMEEVALYTVADGKVTREEFFYDMTGASLLPLRDAGKPGKKASRPSKKKAAKTTRKSAVRAPRKAVRKVVVRKPLSRASKRIGQRGAKKRAKR